MEILKKEIKLKKLIKEIDSLKFNISEFEFRLNENDPLKIVMKDLYKNLKNALPKVVDVHFNLHELTGMMNNLNYLLKKLNFPVSRRKDYEWLYKNLSKLNKDDNGNETDACIKANILLEKLIKECKRLNEIEKNYKNINA